MYITYQKYHNVIYPMRIQPAIASAEPIDILKEAGTGSASGSAVAGVVAVSSPILWEDFNRMSETEKQAYIAEMKNKEQESIQKQDCHPQDRDQQWRHHVHCAGRRGRHP